MSVKHQIPKVFHRIWLGGTPLPDEHTRWGETWQTQHPDWQMRLWNGSWMNTQAEYT